MKSGGFALYCNYQGEITQIIANSDPKLFPIHPNERITDSFHFKNPKEIEELIAKIQQNRAVFNYTFTIFLESTEMILFLNGCEINESIFLVVSLQESEINRFFFDELIRINNEQTNMIRATFKEKAREHKDFDWSKERDEYLIRMTQLNNKFLDAQRELTKKNLQLNSFIEKLEKTNISLRETQERLNQTLDLTDAGILEWNLEKGEVYLSESYSKLLHLSNKPIILPLAVWLAYIHPADRNLVMIFLEKPSSSLQIEFRYRKRPEEWDWALFRAKTDNLSHVVEEGRGVAIQLNITIYKKVVEKTIRQQKMESIGVLAGGVAHEFNNLLTGIMGNISLAQFEVEKPSEISEYLEEASRQCQKGSDLTKKFLTFSEGGEPVRKFEDIIKVIALMLSRLPKFPSIHFQTRFASDLPLLLIDEGQIRQAMSNIIENAIESMPSGGEIIISGEKNEDYVKISIQDHGRGIEPDNISRIFDPFYSTKEMGSGLGLATALSIIQKHEGKIKVNSILGEGSTFSILLPFDPKKTAEKKLH